MQQGPNIQKWVQQEPNVQKRTNWTKRHPLPQDLLPCLWATAHRVDNRCYEHDEDWTHKNTNQWWMTDEQMHNRCTTDAQQTHNGPVTNKMKNGTTCEVHYAPPAPPSLVSNMREVFFCYYIFIVWTTMDTPFAPPSHAFYAWEVFLC
jgi:hypothetical protein